MLQDVGGTQQVSLLTLYWYGIKMQYVNLFSWEFSCCPVDFRGWVCCVWASMIWGAILGLDFFFISWWLLYGGCAVMELAVQTEVHGSTAYLRISSVAGAPVMPCHWGPTDTGVHAFFPQLPFRSCLHIAFHGKDNLDAHTVLSFT